MPVTFEQPWYLLLLALAIPTAVTGLLWLGAMSRARAWSAIIARTLLLALLAATLAGASAVKTTSRLATIAVVDVSDSVTRFGRFGLDAQGTRPPGSRTTPVPAPAEEAVKNWLSEAALASASGPDDLLGVVAFDGSSIAASLPKPVRTSASSLGPSGTARASAPALDFSLDYRSVEGTNIEQALRFAASLVPPDAAPRLVLISDGNETEGDALAAAQELASQGAASGRVDPRGRVQGVPVDVLPVTFRVDREVMIEAIDAPPQAPLGSPVTIRVVLNAASPTTGTLELLYEGSPQDLSGPGTPGTGRRLSLPAGRTVEQIRVKLSPDAIVHRFKPIFIPDDPASDSVASNNASEAFTVTPGPGRVLIVDGVGSAAADSPGRLLARALASGGLSIEVIAPESLPRDPIAYQSYDLVVLEDVAADEVPRPVQQLLADYVQDLGGGLVMVGGPDSFGSGGWKGTPIEPILPVRLDLPEQLLVPSAGVALVLDNSGSMSSPVMGGMRTQQQIANEGAALAIETLDSNDVLTVVAFNSDYSLVVPAQRVRDPRALAARVRSIDSGGGTNLYPALAFAGRELMKGDSAKASIRHIIVLSDGRSEGAVEEGLAIVDRLREQNISVSTISVGDGADDEGLAMLAQRGGGQFYKVLDPNTLPKVFIKEIRIVRKPLVRESPFDPVSTGSGSAALSGLPVPFPTLGGLVLTQRKADPKINLALVTPENEPVMAHWAVGRGQVMAFTSDAHLWAQQWLAWPGYATFWTQSAKVISRPPASRSAELQTEFDGSELIVRLDASDEQGRPMDLLSVPGLLYGPDGVRREISLSQTGPGTYEARTPAPASGNYFVSLLPTQGERALAPVIGGASRVVGAEMRSLTSNSALLRRIAEATGGRLLDFNDPAAAALFDRQLVAPVRASSPIWRLLVMWAIGIFILDVATRRVAWDRLISRELAQIWREEAAAAVKARGERAAGAMARLRTTRRSDTGAARAPADEHAIPLAPAQTDMPSKLPERPRSPRTVQPSPEPPARNPVPAPPAGAKEKPSDAAGSTSAGLLAAKRRAARRLEQSPEPGQTGQEGSSRDPSP